MRSILPGGCTLVLGALEFKIEILAAGRIQLDRKGPAARPRRVAGRVQFENGNSVAVAGVMRAEKDGPATIDQLHVGATAIDNSQEFFELSSGRADQTTGKRSRA